MKFTKLSYDILEGKAAEVCIEVLVSGSPENNLDVVVSTVEDKAQG